MIKRCLLLICTIIISPILLSFSVDYQGTGLDGRTLQLKGFTIIVDAGHGGFDSGAVGPSGIKEDLLNLQVAKKLESLLHSRGARVIMTRTNNDALAPSKAGDMRKRVEIIKKARPDMVISIHMNKFGQSKYYGAQTFYMTGSQEGEKLAEAIQAQLRSNLIEGNNRQTKSASNLLILKAGDAPTVIVECGFLSNPREEALLQESDYQDKIAWSIYRGIIDYISET